MGYASRSGHAVTNPQHPRAFGVCDACGFWFNHHKLRYAVEWQGTQLVNLRFLVCERCWDKPNDQLRAKIVPPDPVPIRDPRPENQLYPRNVSHLGVETTPGSAIATEIWPGNFPAGTPIEIEP